MGKINFEAWIWNKLSPGWSPLECLMLIFFAFDNDDMESLKRRVTFLSLIFLLEL